MNIFVSLTCHRKSAKRMICLAYDKCPISKETFFRYGLVLGNKVKHYVNLNEPLTSWRQMFVVSWITGRDNRFTKNQPISGLQNICSEIYHY